MTITRIVFPFAIALFAVSSCKQRVTQPPDGNVISDFPNKVGNVWTYSSYDSLANQSDTVIVRIVGQTTIPENKSVTVWQKSFGSHIDTVFVSISFDTVRIIPEAHINSQWVNTKYLFPLEVGKAWRGDFVSDTSTVVENRSITVIAGSFPNAFRIEERWSALNDYGAVSTWFVPKVGIVKLHRREWGFGFSNETWELLSYQVSQ